MTYIRLAIAAGILIVMLGLAAGLFYYRGESIAAKAETAKTRAALTTAIEVNTDNEKTITALQNAQAKGEQLAAALAAEVDAANQTTLGIAKSLAELRSKDADVDAYLKQPVPPALRSLYDHAAGGR